MAKAWIIYESWGVCDDSSAIGVFLDEVKANEYVEEHRKEFVEELKCYEKCSQCVNNEGNEVVFKDRDTCEKANIKQDRHGLYCENDMSDYYNAMRSNDYWKVEVDILD